MHRALSSERAVTCPAAMPATASASKADCAQFEHVLDERGRHQRLHLLQRCVKSIEAGERRQGKLDARSASRHTRCGHEELEAEKKSGCHLEQRLGGH